MFTETLWRPDTMLIRVRVTANSRESLVVKVGEAEYEVRVDERATGGRANKRLVEIISEHLGVPKSKISIVRGATSRDKILYIVY